MKWIVVICAAYLFCHRAWSLDYDYNYDPVPVGDVARNNVEVDESPQAAKSSYDGSYDGDNKGDAEYTHELLYPGQNDTETDNLAGISPLPDLNITTATVQIAQNQTQKNSSSSPLKNTAIEKTLQLLELGTQLTSSTSVSDDIILVLGNTGAGKSTITLFLTGNNSELVAYDKDPVTILIKDTRNKISNSTIVSQTIFPELFVDEETEQAFYDCPGFSDTRNTSIEIVNSFFIKKVADHAKRVKILLVVNHNSLKPGGDRKDFMLLVKHTTDFLRNIDNFNNSIALVASKCESTRSDRRIILGMAQFMKEARTQLKTVTSGEDLISAEKLIDILLQQNPKGDYTRLTFFQQPDETGPLSAMKSVQDRKLHIKHTICNSTHFTEKSPTDFGYSISPQAKNDVRSLTDAINGQIVGLFGNISDAFESHYKQLLHSKNQNSKYNNQTLDVIEEELDLFFKNTILLRDPSFMSFSSSSASKFLKKLTVNVSWPNAYADEQQQEKTLNEIVNNGEYLDFLQSITETATTPGLKILRTQRSLWTVPIFNFILNVNSLVIEFSHQQNERMLGFLGEASNKVFDYYDSKLEEMKSQNSTEFKDTLRRLVGFLKTWEELEQDAIASTKLTQFTENVLTTVRYLSPTTEILNESLQSNMRRTGDFLTFVKSHEANVLPKHSHAVIDPVKWLENFNKFIPRVSSILRVEDMLASKLMRAITELGSTMELYYIQKFESNNYSTSGNLREELEADTLYYQRTIQQFEGGFVENENETQTVSTLIVNLAISFTKPISNFETIPSILNSIKSESELLNALHSSSKRDNTTSQPALQAWLGPLKLFVKSLEEVLKPPSCRFKNIQNQITAIVEGTFISLQDLTNSCLTLSHGIQNVLITSLHTIYLDTDLYGLQVNPESSLNLAILSPNWVVTAINNRSTIKLNGASGKEHPSRSSGRLQAFKVSGEGLDGVPGLPGGNGGNFLGVGTTITGGQVNVDTTGGIGGRGQDGGNGSQGVDAENVELQKLRFVSEFPSGDTRINIKFVDHEPYRYDEQDWACTEGHRKEKKTDETFLLFSFIPIGTTRKVQKEDIIMYHCRNYLFYDSRGTPGKRGGNGGAPGLGGKGGLGAIEFPSGSNNNYSEYFTIFSHDGDVGLVGEGGNGGAGGWQGNQVQLRVHPAAGNSNGHNNGMKILSEVNEGHASAEGDKGSSGTNDIDRIPLAPFTYSMDETKNGIVNIYKMFAGTHSENPYVRSTLEHFLEQLSPPRNEGN